MIDSIFKISQLHFVLRFTRRLLHRRKFCLSDWWQIRSIMAWLCIAIYTTVAPSRNDVYWWLMTYSRSPSFTLHCDFHDSCSIWESFVLVIDDTSDPSWLHFVLRFTWFLCSKSQWRVLMLDILKVSQLHFVYCDLHDVCSIRENFVLDTSDPSWLHFVLRFGRHLLQVATTCTDDLWHIQDLPASLCIAIYTIFAPLRESFVLVIDEKSDPSWLHFVCKFKRLLLQVATTCIDDW